MSEQHSLNHSKLAFVGAGKMVSAMVSSLLRSNSFERENLFCCSAKDGTSESLAAATGIGRSETIDDMLCNEPELLILGCKPQQLGLLAASCDAHKVRCVILSIMAGVRISRIQEVFPNARNVVRAMPNTPGQIGEGVTGYVYGAPPQEAEKILTFEVLNALGPAFELKSEEDVDRVTAISGSGPAYLFEFACALEAAASEIGLPADLAKEFAIQTITGSAKLLSTSNLQAEELRNQVTSPNGTTQAALENFSKNNFRGIILEAVRAAKERSVQLSSE